MPPVNEHTIGTGRRMSRLNRLLTLLFPCHFQHTPFMAPPTSNQYTRSLCTSSIYSLTTSTTHLSREPPEPEPEQIPIILRRCSHPHLLLPSIENVQLRNQIEDLTEDLTAYRAHLASLRRQVFVADAAYQDLQDSCDGHIRHNVELAEAARLVGRELRQVKGKNWVLKGQVEGLSQGLETARVEMCARYDRIEGLKVEMGRLERMVCRERRVIRLLKRTRWGRHKDVRGLVVALHKRIEELEEILQRVTKTRDTRERVGDLDS